MIGRVGEDAFGAELKAFLLAQGVDLTFVRRTPDAHTGTALITVAHAENIIVVIPGANALLSAADAGEPVLAKGDIAVSQFEIPLPTVRAFFKHARAAGATTMLNPAPAIAIDRELLDLADVLILNESELGACCIRALKRGRAERRTHDCVRSLVCDGEFVHTSVVTTKAPYRPAYR